MSTAPGRNPRKLIVRRLTDRAARGVLELGPYRFACALGRGGVRARKVEGDGATPRGRFGLEGVLYNPGRWPQRAMGPLPAKPVRPGDGWCDAVDDRNYNRPVRHPYPASAEHLWRSDGLYDVVIVVAYNRLPRVRGKGSAIFIHIAGPGTQQRDLPPTAGCVAVGAADMRKLLAALRRPVCLITDA